MLGPKAGFFKSLAKELWGPVSRRTEVRQALFWASGGLVLMAGGLVGIVVTGEALTAIVVGLLAMASAWNTWKEHRALWWAWRRIGDVALVGPPTELVPGEVASVCTRIVPRKSGAVESLTLTFAWRDSRSGPAGTAWAVDADVTDEQLLPGVVREYVAEVCLPPGVPASRFENGWTRQWTCTAQLTLRDGRVWEREYPVFVLPTP